MIAEIALLPSPLVQVEPAEPALTRFVPQEPSARKRFEEFFTVHIRNKNTRAAYLTAARSFADWCAGQGIAASRDVEPIHVAAYVEQIGEKTSKPTAKQHLAALRMLFDWLVTGQALSSNPAHSVRGPRYSVRKGKTPVLTADEMRELLASIETDSLIGLRDRALLALLSYTFARVSAAVGMTVEDLHPGAQELHSPTGERRQSTRAPGAPQSGCVFGRVHPNRSPGGRATFAPLSSGSRQNRPARN
jgi:site-specific recombinase XerD